MDLRLLRRDAGHLSDLRLPLPALPPKRLVVGLKQGASLGTLNFQPWLRTALERLERQLPMVRLTGPAKGGANPVCVPEGLLHRWISAPRSRLWLACLWRSQGAETAPESPVPQLRLQVGAYTRGLRCLPG